MKNIDIKLNVMVVTFMVFVLILYFTTIDNNRVSCKYYIPNIYMYVILGVLLVGIFTLLREKYLTKPDERYKLYKLTDEENDGNFYMGIVLGIIALIILFSYGFFNMTLYKNHLLNHFVWIIILIGISTLFYPLFKLEIAHNYISTAALYVVIIFIVMSGLVYTNYKTFLNMNDSKLSWIGMGLLGGLISIILGTLLLIILQMFGLLEPESFISIFKIILYISIFIFSLYISYDSIYIIKRNKSCNANNKYLYPNYPMESFQIFIDLYNIFADLIQLKLLGSLNIS